MKTNNAPKLIILLIIFCLTMLVTVCNSEPVAPTITPTHSPTETPPPFPAVCGKESSSDTPTMAPTNLSAEDIAAQAMGLKTAIADRMPIPTPTPDIVDQFVVNIVEQAGLSDATFLELTTEDWIDILVSLLIFCFSLVIIIPLLFRLITWVVRRTKTRFDDDFFDAIKRELSWLVAVLIGCYIILPNPDVEYP